MQNAQEHSFVQPTHSCFWMWNTASFIDIASITDCLMHLLSFSVPRTADIILSAVICFVSERPYAQQIAVDCWPSRPALPISCQYDKHDFAAPQWTTILMSLICMPIPNAMVAKRQRMQLSGFLKDSNILFLLSSSMERWYMSISPSGVPRSRNASLKCTYSRAVALTDLKHENKS